MGARVEASPDGTLKVIMSRIPAVDLDRNCVYPVVNKKTGGHTHTFATWQGDLTRTSSFRFATGDVLLVLSLQENPSGQTSVEFWGNCVADTELGRLPAESTGVFEEKFLNKLFAEAGQRLGSIPARTHDKDAPAEEAYKETHDLTPGNHKQLIRALLPGVSERTLVKVSVAASTEVVWRAAVAATTKLSEQTGRPVVRVDEQTHTIQNGTAAGRGILPSREERWSDEFITSVTPDGSQTRLSVVRRLRISSDDGVTWRGAPSDGEIESWIVTEALTRVAAGNNEQSPAKAAGAPKNPVEPSCTVEQVGKMKEAGLTDVQIRAACSPK
jgi:hypothetical protein